MANVVDLKDVLKNLVNGKLEENLCIVCLMPLDDLCESIYTRICKEDKEYCVADVFQLLFHKKFLNSGNYSVCSDCFVSASATYKFCLLAQRSNEILNFYINTLENNIDTLQLPEDDVISSCSICISLPLFEPKTPFYNFGIEATSSVVNGLEQNSELDATHDEIMTNIKEEPESDEEVFIITTEDGERFLYKKNTDTKSTKITEISKNNIKKRRKKRLPMAYRSCTLCPLKYRFISRLKHHMKNDHNIDIYICKICKAFIQGENEYHTHLKTHTNVHICSVCDMVFKRRKTIIKHIKQHEDIKKMSQKNGAHVCEICGQILPSEEHLKEHCDMKHEKKYTCYYCGKMYRGVLSFDSHIKKHEDNAKSKKKKAREILKRSSYHCSQCDKCFVDQRALMWHNRLHTNERPFICDVCGRGFVTVNRRNQHALCAHTAPTRQCPLCPALFHLRSMVNTHIRKVHLKAHKHRYRIRKHKDVFWRTETVPIQELSVDIQNDILELQANQAKKPTYMKIPTYQHDVIMAASKH